MEFESKFRSARVGGNKSDKQLSKMVHKATYDLKHGKGLKMLTPK